MGDEFDVTKMAADVAQQSLEKILSSTIAGVKGLTSQVRARIDRTYRQYIERLLERYGKGKSFFVRTEAIPLYEFFVPLDLTTQSRRLTTPTAANVFSLFSRVVLTGTGGSGKSMMMRHLLVSAIKEEIGTPLFLELRELNNTSVTIQHALQRTLEVFGLDVDDSFLRSALKDGQFVIFLDGFDEVEHALRKRIAREIRDLASQYPKTAIVLSSRPDSSLQGWETFTELQVDPLTLAQATELVQKVPFDEKVKERFVRDMQQGLFDKHESFLSNPLLLSIMLLTYGDVAYIPQKLSTFYGQAFEALFHRHDALKSGFQRERSSGLDIQEFGRVFAAFSLFSYDQREFAFTEARALELIGAARDAAMLDFNEEAFLIDAIQAVCLLLEEGLSITFAHRSFQEYFVARFIQASPPEMKAKLVERFSVTVQSDSVMALLWEMDPYIVEKAYLLPKLAAVRAMTGVRKKVGTTHLLRYLKGVYGEFHRLDVPNEDGTRVSANLANEPIQTASLFAFRRYRDWQAARAARNLEDTEVILEQALRLDHGEATDIPAKNLKRGGQFIREVATHGLIWGRQFLQDLMNIENEIRTKHESNRESLTTLLATSRSPSRAQLAR
jgi:hypothetical protein